MKFHQMAMEFHEPRYYAVECSASVSMRQGAPTPYARGPYSRNERPIYRRARHA
jgi:hypothetical protein